MKNQINNNTNLKTVSNDLIDDIKRMIKNGDFKNSPKILFDSIPPMEDNLYVSC